MIYLRRLPHTRREQSSSQLHIKAHELARDALVAARAGDTAALAADEKGRPIAVNMDDWQISITHCDGLAACALGAFPIGVDAEPLDRQAREAVRQRVLSPSEIAIVEQAENPDQMFFRLWTLKEALGKCRGVGLGYPLRETRFSLDAAGRISCSENGFLFAQYVPWGAYVLSVCVSRGGEKSGLESIGYVFDEISPEACGLIVL